MIAVFYATGFVAFSIWLAVRIVNGWRPTRRFAALTVSAVAVLFGIWAGLTHFQYRRQMAAIAVVERLGGSVDYHYEAPEWLLRLRPGVAFFGAEPIGPDALRRWLPAETILDYTVVINGVSLDNGPGMTFRSNLSGEWRDVEVEDPTDADLIYVAQFDKLERLYLRETRIGDAGLAKLRGLRHIKTLYLSFTQITDASMDLVAGFEHLETLRLVGTRVSDTGLARLANLKHLQELDVRKTRVTDAGLALFRGRAGLTLVNDDDHPGYLTHY
jgi:hypothetical protein